MTEPTTVHPSWCDPRQCHAEIVHGAPTGSVFHWGADVALTDGPFDVAITLSRHDSEDGTIGAPLLLVEGGARDDPISVDQLDQFGRWLTEQAAEFRRAIASEGGPR